MEFPKKGDMVMLRSWRRIYYQQACFEKCWDRSWLNPEYKDYEVQVSTDNENWEVVDIVKNNEDDARILI